MNVLILGGNGFIGRNIIKKAIKLNWKIYSLNKNKSYHNIHNIIDLTIDVNNYEDVKNKYEQIDYITLLESKFDINIFKLIENKSLATFYDIFNKLKFDSNVFNINITIIWN